MKINHYNKLQTAQHIAWDASGLFSSGFNRRIYGETIAEATKDQPLAVHQGYNYADKLIKNGEIYYIHNFHQKECVGMAFQYGGFWVCNTCGGKAVDESWWTIRVFQDGNEFCCVGENFVNLQESNNYAFGKSRAEAINNYGDIMISGRK